MRIRVCSFISFLVSSVVSLTFNTNSIPEKNGKVKHFLKKSYSQSYSHGTENAARRVPSIKLYLFYIIHRRATV